MRTLARCIAYFLFALLIVGKVVATGMKEGWGFVLFELGFIAVLFGSVWYGFLRDD